MDLLKLRRAAQYEVAFQDKKWIDNLRRYLLLLAICSVFILLELLMTVSYLKIDVKINGKDLKIPRGLRVEDISRVDERYENGDLLSVKRKVLIKGGGNAPLVISEGFVLEQNDIIMPGAALAVSPGGDKYEQNILHNSPIDYDITLLGKGSVFNLIQDGKNGRSIERKGAMTGEESTFFVIPPEELIYERKKLKSKKIIALTFDDGPSRFTLSLMNLLKEQQVRATFFVNGRNVEKYPWVIRAMVKEKHVIGNHSYSHAMLTSLNSDQLEEELKKTNEVVLLLGGGTIEFFRPPYGGYNKPVLKAAAKERVFPVLWDIDPKDWAGLNASSIAQNILNHATPGSVILLHDGGGNRSETLKAVEIVIPLLKAQGYSFVTVDEMLAEAEKN